MSRETHCGKELTCANEGGRKVCRSGVKLSAAQIAAAAIAAGFDAGAMHKTIIGGKSYTDAAIITAIGMHESGSDPFVIAYGGDGGLGDNYAGIWQISSVHGLGCDRLDPGKAAKAAFRISGGGITFSPWESYTNDAYLKHLDEAQKAVDADPDAVQDWGDLLRELEESGIPGAGGLAKVWSTADKISAIFDFFSKLIDSLTSATTWIRLVEIVGGLILIGFGLVWLAKTAD